MSAIHNYTIYGMADVLGMSIQWDKKTNRLTGEGERIVLFESLPIRFKQKVVSSAVVGKDAMVIVRVVGNLYLLVCAVGKARLEDPEVSLFLLNLAKMDKPEGWLEAEKPDSIEAAVKRLGKGVAAAFLRDSKFKWKPLALTGLSEGKHDAAYLDVR
jgi:hypothetical protein